MRISVFGLGYVGSVTAAGMARLGHQVWGVDVAPEKVATVRAGASPVLEPGLSALISAQIRTGRLTATTSSQEALDASELALICVGTPSRSSGQPDLSALERVRDDLAAGLRERRGEYTVVLRSTVLPGTIERLFAPLAEELRDHLELRLAVNPEFMREGSALHDFAAPPLILIGADSARAAAQLRTLWAGVDARVVETALRTAEMVKPVCNAFHALKVCFANEVACLSETLGADGNEVMRVFALDDRLNLSAAYLRPGFAFGGSCLPKDVRALAQAARGHDLEAPLLGALLPSNQAQLARGLERIIAAGKRRIGVIGLAFKPGSDDLRESPYLALVESLIGKGYEVRVYDRHVSLGDLVGANRRQLQQRLPHIDLVLSRSLGALLAHAEVLVIAHRGQDSERALAALRPHQQVIDLTPEPARAAPLDAAAGS